MSRKYSHVIVIGVDGAGHGTGYGLSAFIERIHEVNKLISDVYSAVKNAGMLEDTLFIVIADHDDPMMKTARAVTADGLTKKNISIYQVYKQLI